MYVCRINQLNSNSSTLHNAIDKVIVYVAGVANFLSSTFPSSRIERLGEPFLGIFGCTGRWGFVVRLPFGLLVGTHYTSR